MRRIIVLLAGSVLAASAAQAADQLKFGPVPDWVLRQQIPQISTTAPDAPVAFLLNDSQARLERGRIVGFTELALKIQSAEGLSAGNVAFVWQPATDTVTVNKLEILRGDKVIDVLASGQTFTIARRETNLDAATLDGTLTATLQPEGLQVGDIIRLATTHEHVDPVMKGHVEGNYGMWNGTALELGHARISWPAAIAMNSRQSEDLPKPSLSTSAGFKTLELTGRALEPLVPPAGAPTRFTIGRLGEFSDFRSWSDVADLMRPLFEEAAIIPASGPLRSELEAIRSQAKGPKQRVELALQLVEDRVRYVALLMGTGSYVPASAETTWSRRFGDCKAKTALLLGLLRELGIEAEAVLVNSTFGDALPGRLPMVSYFNHVIVRAHIDGKTYWLDGTRSGDRDLDRIQVANFGWGLPLLAKSELAQIVPRPLDHPNRERRVTIDAAKGVFGPVPFTIEEKYRGDSALQLNILLSQAASAQRDEILRAVAIRYFDSPSVDSANSSYDKETGEFRISLKGTTKLGWDDGWLHVPTSGIAYNPDFRRAPGRWKDAPWTTGFPSFSEDKVTVHLPPGFARGQKLPAAVQETLAGVEYGRKATLVGDSVIVETSERSLAPEIPYKEALAAESRLRALDKDDVYLRLPSGYIATAADLDALAQRTLASASDYIQRGNDYIDADKRDEAIADFTKALELDPGNSEALLSRGRLFGSRGKFDEAIADFSKVLAAEPKHVGALIGRAMALTQKRDFAAAERDIATIEQIDVGNDRVASLRALVDLQKQDHRAAEAKLSEAIRANPGDLWATLQRASIRIEDGRAMEAIADYTTVLQAEPDLLPALIGRANAFHQMGEEEKALADSDRVVEMGPNAEIRLLRANIYRAQGKHDLAVKEAQTLVRESPDKDFALVAAGKILAAEGKRKEALDILDRAVALKPQVYIYVNRSQVREPTDYAGRMADLDEALKLQPGHPDAVSAKAELLMEQKRFAEAAKTYDALMKTVQNPPPELLSGHAIALYKAGRIADAQKQVTAARGAAKLAAEFNNLCWAKATAGVMLEAALEECREAVKLDPGAAVKDSLGMVQLRSGKLAEAIATYTEAIDKRPIAESYMGRAIAYARSGDAHRAQADRALALRLDPQVEAEFERYGLKLADPSEQPRQ